MNRKPAILGIAFSAVFYAALTIFLVQRCRANPLENTYRTQADAVRAASNFARFTGGRLFLTSGTRSMQPLIVGKVYAVAVKNLSSVAQGDLVAYRGRPDANKSDRVEMLHRAVQHDKYGWLMSGDNNRWTESWDRVAADNYDGTVIALFAFPQE